MRAAPAADEVQRFREIIARRLGLQFDDSKLGFLTDVLWRRLDAGDIGGADYLAGLEGVRLGAELHGLAPELTVPETYFFRNIDQFHAFSERVVPDRIRARGQSRVLRFLSAGCATGEEAYTIAIALRELPVDPSWDVSIRAIDLNRAVLERAARGIFSPWALRETPPAIRARWFHERGRELQLHQDIRNRVVFTQKNLVDDDPDVWRPEQYDVVFCRNVLMYFVPRTAQVVIERIARSLAPGGFLFLGHAESLRGVSSDYHLCHTHGTFYYQRKEEGERTAARSDAPAWPHAAPARIVEPADLLTGSWIEAIARASERIRSLSQGGDAPAPTRSVDRTWDLRSPLELLRQERYGEALDVLGALPPASARDPDVRILEAVLLAHSGQLARAERTSHALLELDDLNAGAHYVLSLCREGAGDTAGAVEHDEIAAYLDPTFAMPRLHLGLMARRAGDRDAAQRHLGMALDLLQREEASRLLFFGGGFGRDALSTLCRDALLACGGRA